MRFKRVLALGPHTDDVELGAGGTIARLVEEGAQVRVVHFTVGNANRSEAMAAGDVLGVHVMDFADKFETRNLPRDRQLVLDILRGLSRAYTPDLVLCPSSYDFHQDHEVIRAEALRAFRTCTLWGYELPWSCRQFDAQLLVSLRADQVADKVDAVACYQSQAEKRYTDILCYLARVRGAQGGTDYAEAFEVIRWTM